VGPVCLPFRFPTTAVGTKVTVLGKSLSSFWTLKNCLKINHYLQFCIVVPVCSIFTKKPTQDAHD
jgi:hypothetical protein